MAFRHLSAVVLILTVALGGCAQRNEPSAPLPQGDDTGCADVIGVEIVSEPGGSYRFDVTVASADVGWEKYADAWVVRSPDGEVLAERVLTHPHVEEQPFTRSMSGLSVPEDLAEVTVAARDSVDGFCGEVMTVMLG